MMEIEMLMKLINSLLFRFIIFFTLVIIQLCSNGNVFFNDEVYFCGLLIYLIGHVITLKLNNVKKYKGRLRFFLDIIFIVFFLYGKNLDFLINFLPFMLLVINSPNHSGKKGNFLLFILVVHLSVIIVDMGFSWAHHLILMSFYYIIFSYTVKGKITQINQDVFRLINVSIMMDLDNNKSHKLLTVIKDKINNSRLGTFFKIDEILFFRIHKNKLIPLKGTSFIRDYTSFETDNISSMISSKSDVSINKNDFKVNDKNRSGALCLKTKSKNNDFVFIIFLNEYNIFISYLFIQIRPIFHHVTRFYMLQTKLRAYNKKQSEIIKNKIAFVFDAQNALHYVNNKLSPVTEVLDLLNRYFQYVDDNDEKKSAYVKKALQESSTSNSKYLHDVLSKAEFLIKGVDNLLETEEEPVKIRYVIDILRDNWIHHFDEVDNVILNIEDNELDRHEIMFNTSMFEYIFTDIIENINKYNNGFKQAVFSVEDDELIILFSNNIINYSKEIERLKVLILMYNKKGNEEIFNRRSHGLNFIRRLMNRKNIINSIKLNEEKRIFNLEIRLKINENISIRKS